MDLRALGKLQDVKDAQEDVWALGLSTGMAGILFSLGPQHFRAADSFQPTLIPRKVFFFPRWSARIPRNFSGISPGHVSTLACVLTPSHCGDHASRTIVDNEVYLSKLAYQGAYWPNILFTGVRNISASRFIALPASVGSWGLTTIFRGMLTRSPWSKLDRGECSPTLQAPPDWRHFWKSMPYLVKNVSATYERWWHRIAGVTCSVVHL